MTTNYDINGGAGSLGAGEGPAGHEDEADPSTVVVQTPVAALTFDPFDLVYVRNADLTMLAGAGPIQRAAHLMLPLGAIPAVHTHGLDIAAIKRASPLQRKRTIEDELRVAWKTLLDTGQILMGKVTLDPSVPWSGRFEVEVIDIVTETSTTLTNIPAPKASTVPAGPQLASILPITGVAAGGTSVVFTGSGFLHTTATGAAAVKFGATNATSYVVDSDTQITAVSPAHAAGAVTVTVTTPFGAAFIVNGYTYT